jgi:hypothetical protein
MGSSPVKRQNLGITGLAANKDEAVQMKQTTDYRAMLTRGGKDGMVSKQNEYYI